MSYWLKFLRDQWRFFWHNSFGRLFLFLITALFIAVLIYYFKLPELLYNIPLTIFVASLVTFLYETLAFKQFIEDRMTNLFERPDFLSNLNLKRLDAIRENIYRVYYRIPDQLPPDNLYYFIRNNVLIYLNKPFIEDFNQVREVEKISDEETRIIITAHYKFITLSEELQEGFLPLRIVVNRIPDRNEHFFFPGDYIRVNGQEIDISEEVRRGKPINDHALGFSPSILYRVTRDSPVEVSYKITVWEALLQHHEHLECSILPLNGFKLRISLHKFKHCNFSYIFHGIIRPKPDDISQTHFSFSIEYKGWMIPGNGFTVVYNEIP